MGYFDKFKREGVPFMEGATLGKITDHLGEDLHIDEFGIINSKEYGITGVVHFKEYPGYFFFANEILTEMLIAVRDDNMQGLLSASVIRFSLKTSKNGRDYIAYEIDEFKPNA